jgi:hypothetical protein
MYVASGTRTIDVDGYEFRIDEPSAEDGLRSFDELPVVQNKFGTLDQRPVSASLSLLASYQNWMDCEVILVLWTCCAGLACRQTPFSIFRVRSAIE